MITYPTGINNTQTRRIGGTIGLRWNILSKIGSVTNILNSSVKNIFFD